jgi:Tfp pilus assembly protein PilZ
VSESDETGDDRRRAERIPINDEFARLGEADLTWVSDLSDGGVFVHTAELLPVGAMIELRFTILAEAEDPVLIEATGKVVRHSRKPPGMGVEFVQLSAEVRERIEQELRRRQPLDSGAPLRLPEPSRSPAPIIDEDDEDDASERVAFARPAPVGGFNVRPARAHAFEDAVTASFPRVQAEAADFQVTDLDDDATRSYPALRRPK